MSEDLKNKTVMVVDNGLFVSFARKLAPSFKKVYYHVPWQCAFPKSNQLLVGTGFDEIERIKFPLDYLDKVDLWVFLDLYQSDLQLFLESKGCRVWGCRKGEEMELFRWDFKQHLKSIGLPVQHCECIVGLDSLRKHLRGVKNKFIKTSIVRGDFESFHHTTYELSEPRLDELEHHLGAAKFHYEFLVEDDIPDAVEVGYDGFTIDGKFPSHAMMAYEVKDVGMIGTVLPYNKLAEPVKVVNEKLVSTLKGYSYRGYLSTEIRYTKDKKSYLIDPCCRLGTPSNELLQELFGSWAQTLWDGANGEVTVPKEVAKFGCLIMLHSEWAVENWLAVRCPKEVEPFLKLRFCCKVDGTLYTIPQSVGLPDIGCVVGTGDTLLSAIQVAVSRAKQVEAFQLHINIESVDKALDVIRKGEKMGIKFSDSLPTVEQLKKVVS